MWVQIAILIISALIQYALAPKPKAPEKQHAQVPEMADGKPIRVIFGTVWVDDSAMLGWKEEGTTKIKAKGKK